MCCAVPHLQYTPPAERTIVAWTTITLMAEHDAIPASSMSRCWLGIRWSGSRGRLLPHNLGDAPTCLSSKGATIGGIQCQPGCRGSDMLAIAQLAGKEPWIALLGDVGRPAMGPIATRRLGGIL